MLPCIPLRFRSGLLAVLGLAGASLARGETATPSFGGAAESTVVLDPFKVKSDSLEGYRTQSSASGLGFTLPIEKVLIAPNPGREFADATHGAAFRGHYAVVTLDERGACSSVDLGVGRKFILCGTALRAAGVGAMAATIHRDAATVTATPATELIFPDGRRESARRLPSSSAP